MPTILRRDARDLMAQLWTWQNGDISANDLYRGDLQMALAGITCVGEFHYLHHAPGGTPYTDPNEMGQRLLAAAVRQRHAGDHGLGNQFLQLIAVAHVVVEGHRAGSQRAGQGPHAQPGQPVAVHDLQRGRLDLLDREPCPNHDASSG